MKIIIVGCGKVGTTLAEQLNRENHDITLIDCDSEALQSISGQHGCYERYRKRSRVSGTDGGRDQGSGFADCHHQFR